jgi:dTDP-4-dehydrorhamnose reductase
MKSKSIVVGGNSLIGQSIIKYNNSNNINIYNTTRIKNKSIFNIKFDLTNNNYNLGDINFNKIYYCIGNFGIQYCNDNILKSRNFNIDLTFKFLDHYIKKNKKIFIFSSSQVFSHSKIKYNSEKNKVNSVIEMGKQKIEIENFIKKSTHNFAIIRLGKIISFKDIFFLNLINSLKNNKEIELYQDYFFSPFSIKFFNNCLFNNEFTNIVHLSGARNISYYKFGIELARKFNFSESLIIPKKIDKKNNFFQFSSQFLKLDYTRKQYNINPQNILDVVEDCYDEYIESDL